VRAACPSHVQFRSGYCYEYARDFPYSPVVDLLSRAWDISELDSPDDVRERIERSVAHRVADDESLGARIARLWGLDSPKLHGLDPETWRQRLPGDIGAVLSSLARSAPTVVVLEDLHWADSSSLELLESILAQSGPGVLYLCTARPPFAFTTERDTPGLDFVDIELREFEPEDASRMVSSLLHTDSVPEGLDALVREHAGGNPFYLEQLVSSLAQSNALEESGNGWRLGAGLDSIQVPAGAREMLAARVDRLSEGDRRVLTRAAVLGQAFSQEALDAITGNDGIEEALQRLVAEGLVEPFGGERRFRFRHALLKEAVYDSLLRKERRELHEAAGRAIEKLYAERLSEHYEMLAMHFSEGVSEDRAITYLVYSGEKSVERFALDQADSYFSRARVLIETAKPQRGPDGELLAVDLVTRWAPVFWYRGDFLGLEQLLNEHADAGTEELPDAQRGRFAAWLGTTCWNRQMLDSSRTWLEEALRVAEEAGDETTMCFAHAWLSYTLTDLGRIEAGIRHGLEARHLTEAFEDNHFLVAHSHGASAYAFWAAGEVQGALEAGRQLLEHAERHSSARTTVFGLWARALGYVCDGDYESAERAIGEALDVSSDPWTSQFPRMFAGLCCVYRDDFAGAREHLEEVLRFADSRGAATLATPARGLLGASLVGLGELNEGMAMLRQAREEFEAGNRPWGTAQAIFIIGSLHARIAARSVDVSVSTALRNVGFVIHEVPRAATRACEELEQSLRMCQEMGARGMAGRCRMELGDLASARKRTDEALRLWGEAAADFEACGANTLVEEARGRAAALAG
jgi:tetratricopeptide (TPR) repeat protein